MSAAPLLGQASARRANPASENCIALGGTLSIEKRGDSGEYGVCRFEDNRQCEEWALLRGACPPGGLKVTGYATVAARYCAITGGTYRTTGNPNSEHEQGTCTLPGGQSCDVWAYFNGSCSVTLAAQAMEGVDPFAYCASVGDVDLLYPPYKGPALPDAVVKGLISLGVVSADAPAEFQRHAVWRCMDGQVVACHFGANLPCLEKADTSRVPSAEMAGFCAAEPAAAAIPAAVTGRATVYAWGCRAGKPAVLSQLFHPDARGFLAELWHPLPRPSSP
jgi:putative hemolysin